jgi:hypothetical protein
VKRYRLLARRIGVKTTGVERQGGLPRGSTVP